MKTPPPAAPAAPPRNATSMQKKWVLRQKPATEQVAAMQQALHRPTAHEAIISLLLQRGLQDPYQVHQYFGAGYDQLHNPFLLKDMGKAVARILQAVEQQEAIMIFGDYDVDGTTSLVTVYQYLRQLTPLVGYRVPDGYSEGYGVSNDAIEAARRAGVKLFISLDCGIKAFEQCALARSYGIDVIIIDHHLPEGAHLPDAFAVIDPRREDCPYPYKELSAAGLGFKLLQALAHAQNQPREVLLPWLDLVVCSIAADLVPITGENRVLASLGLEQLSRNPRPGLKALLRQAGFERRSEEVGRNGGSHVPVHRMPDKGIDMGDGWQISISSIVFGIGPRINSAGRMGDAKDAVELLLAHDDESALRAAEKLNIHNNRRKEQDSQTTQEALAMIESSAEKRNASATVLFSPGWNKGVIGIVASRCIEHYHRPTVILTENNGMVTGSARTVNGFDIYDALYACADLLEQFGGHRFAAGLSLKRENLPAFMQRFEMAVQRGSGAGDQEPVLDIDLELRIKEITLSLAKSVMKMAPFGPGNQQPVFCSRNVWADSGRSKKVQGRRMNGGAGHLKLFVNQEDGYVQEAIGFGMGAWLDQLDLSRPFDICYHIELKHYAGQDHVQLILKDIQQSESPQLS